MTTDDCCRWDSRERAAGLDVHAHDDGEGTQPCGEGLGGGQPPLGRRDSVPGTHAVISQRVLYQVFDLLSCSCSHWFCKTVRENYLKCTIQVQLV